MASLSHAIATAVLAKLETIPGLTVRWFDDVDPEPGVAYLVLSDNQVTGLLSDGGVYRTLTGHVGFTYETDLDADGGVAAMDREAVDELVTKVEAALLEFADEIADEPTAPADAEFSLVGVSYGHAGESGGMFAARIEWQCRYRHAARNPRVSA